MARLMQQVLNRIRGSEFTARCMGFISSIYGRVVIIIILAFTSLLILFNIISRTVYADYFTKSMRQTGDNISSIVEGALYYSMLENDKLTLQRTLDVISTMSGIDEVSLYDHLDSIALTSYPEKDMVLHDTDCVPCPKQLDYMFPTEGDTYRIVEHEVQARDNMNEASLRQLLIRKPILNERSCYTAACHYHTEDEVTLGTLIIKLPLQEFDAVIEESSTDFFLLLVLISILLLTVLLLFTRRNIHKPLNSIIEASEAVSGGRDNIRLEIKPNLLSDMRKVSMAFNKMLDHTESTTLELQNWSQQLEYKVQKKTEELLEAQNELIHVERIASLGKLSSSVAHEINNPLSGILVYTKLIHKQLSNSDYHHEKKESILRHLSLIENETKRCGDIVKGLLDFSKKEKEDFEDSDLHMLLEGTYKLMDHSIRIAGINFIKELRAEKCLIHCSPNQIKQAFVALLQNASEAVGENGEITVRTSNPDANSILVEIEDNGSGIATQDLAHIFEPFFSTKQDVSGIGLGLAIVHGIVENHDGKIEVNSEQGRGTLIGIRFPLLMNKMK